MWIHLSVALWKDKLYVFNKPSGNIMPNDVIEQNIFPHSHSTPPPPPPPRPSPALCHSRTRCTFAGCYGCCCHCCFVPGIPAIVCKKKKRGGGGEQFGIVIYSSHLTAYSKSVTAGLFFEILDFNQTPHFAAGVYSSHRLAPASCRQRA